MQVIRSLPLFLSNKLSSDTPLAHASRFARQHTRPVHTALVFTNRFFDLLHRQVRGRSRVPVCRLHLLGLPPEAPEGFWFRISLSWTYGDLCGKRKRVVAKTRVASQASEL